MMRSTMNNSADEDDFAPNPFRSTTTDFLDGPPPQQNQQQNQPQDQQQQQQQNQQQPEPQQTEPEEQQMDPTRALQAVRDREAQRRRDKNERQNATQVPVAKDW